VSLIQFADYDASVVLTNKSLKEAEKSERAADKKELSKLQAKLHTANTVLKVHSRALFKMQLLEKKSLDASLDLYIRISELKESMRRI
jgi:hypothetical protein